MATSNAIVHEWLSELTGSEKTFLQMATVLPDADLFALSDNSQGWEGLNGRPITTTCLNRFTRSPTGRALSLPLMPLAYTQLGRGRHYQTIITSSHAYSRYFGATYDRHLCYVYSPLRYAWFPEIDGRGAGRSLAPARAILRALDRHSANRVDAFAAISTTVKQRIERCYGREAEVIFPPVDTTYFGSPISGTSVNVPPIPFLLSIGRLIPYKRHDVAIRLSHEARIPLVIAGTGPAESHLRGLALHLGADVRFVGRVTDADLRDLYRSAVATVFLAEEDFGIVPVESQAAGTPVLALDAGGSTDTVGTLGGRLAPSIEIPQLLESLTELLERPPSRDECTANAARFSVSVFRSAFGAWVSA